MVRRLNLAGAVAVCAVLAAGIGAWLLHVDALSSTMDAQAAFARTLLAKAGPDDDPQTIANAVTVRGVRVDVRPAGPPGFPPGAPPGSPGPPGPAGPLAGGASFERLGPLEAVVADLARVQPRRVDGEDFGLVIVPDPAPLTRWFLSDVVLCAIAVIAIAFGVRALAGSLERSASERQRAEDAHYRRFLADAGHELRTPLTIVIGYIDVLAEHLEANDPKGERIVEGLRAETKRMRSLVEKMLQLSKLEARASSQQTIDVASAITDLVDEARRQNPGRTISAHCEPGLAVACDEDELFEALRNLVENALRYAPASDVRISSARAGDAVAIAVTDRGAGIAPGERDLVFERFYRGSASDGIQGSGLGLSIVRGVAERWGGSVALASNGDGTRFTLSLPAARALEGSAR